MEERGERIGRRHPRLSEYRRAFRAAATPDGTVLVPLEGPRLLAEALRSGVRLESVLFSATGYKHFSAKLLPQLARNTAVYIADDDAFQAAMDVVHPQGVAALARLACARPERLLHPQPPLLLCAAGLQDPGNLGTLVRAAEAFGASGMIVLEQTVSPFNPKAVRASAGSLFRLPVIAPMTIAELTGFCRGHGIRLLAAAPRPACGGEPGDLTGPICLAIGQEAAGLPRELQRAAEATVSIPILRNVDSLNAGVAGAILLYEAARQRRGH